MTTVQTRLNFQSSGWTILVDGREIAEATDREQAHLITGLLSAYYDEKELAETSVAPLRGQSGDPSLNELLIRAFELGRHGR